MDINRELPSDLIIFSMCTYITWIYSEIPKELRVVLIGNNEREFLFEGLKNFFSFYDF